MTDIAIEADGEHLARLAMAVRIGHHRGAAKHVAQAIAAGSTVLLIGVRVRIAGWSVLSTDGVTAPVVTFLNGSNANSEVLGFATPALGLSQGQNFTPPGLDASNGVGVAVTGGAATVVLWYYPD